MAQQKAVEWLEEQLNKWSDGRFYLPPHLFEQAKQMDKEQKIEAHIAGQCIERTFGTYYAAEQYYNETYES